MRIQGPANRRGFTLLEVLLASSIGLMILYGLYLAIDVNLRFADSGRNAVEHATLARSLTARINADLAPCVGLPDPTRYKKKPNSNTSQSGGQQGGGQPSGGQQGGGQQGGGQQQSGNMTDSSSGDDSTTATPTTTGDPVRTVQGDETTLSVFVNRLPKFTPITQQMSSSSSNDEENNGLDSDQRVIMYKFEEGKGLWRYEGNLTNLNMDGTPVTKGELIAPEVKSMSISYYDGTSWENSWNGALPSPDNPTSGTEGQTPIGPPLAIAITLELNNKANPDKPYKIRHVIAIPTAHGKAQLSTDDSLSTEGTPSSSP